MTRERTLARAIRGQVRSQELGHRIAELARRQYGTVARRQLRSLGASEDQIDRWVHAGRLHRLHRGVYTVGHRRVTDEGRWMAAVLLGGPGSALSHRCAGAHWQLIHWSGRAAITVPTRRRGPGDVDFHSRALPADELTVHDGIPITTVARTLFDLASVLSDERLLNAVNEADEQGLGSPLSLPATIERHRGERGAGALRRVLDRAGYGIPRRELEVRFARFIADFRLPSPHLNASVWVGDRAYVADALWSKARVIVELHSIRHHGTGPKISRDAQRDRRLLMAGYVVVHLTWAQLADSSERRALARDLRRLLSR
jgi:very-short-patch-repair endonuclease/predicted transcriptional regulator of viral defense system